MTREQQGRLVEARVETPLEAEIAARMAATRSGKTYISPYNDPEVIAGQGTIAIELLRQAGRIDDADDPVADQ